MALNIVARSIDQSIQETVQKRKFVGENDILINPTVTPLLAMTTKAGNRKKTTDAARVEWIEDDFVGVWGQVSNSPTDYSSVATTIAVADGTFFAVGDLLAIPKAITSSAAPEIVRVTANSSNILTITRNIGGAGADTINSTIDIRIVAPAYAEGGAFGTVRNTTKAVKISYTEIFRKPVQITKSMVAQAQFGMPPNERRFQQKKAMEELKKAIESAGIWGRASESLALPGTIRTTMGLNSRITTNLYNANTTLTESGLETFVEGAFSKYYEGEEKLFLAAVRVISALDFFSTGKVRFTGGPQVVLGVKVRRYVTSHGDLLVVRDLLLENAPLATTTGFGGSAYAVDINSVEFCPLAGNGENRDTQLLENVVRDGSDQYQDEWLCEAAWVVRHESRHARLYGCSAFA